MTYTPTKPIPKSLHTVTVLVAVARLHLRKYVSGGSPGLAVDDAIETLGLAGKPDTYGLRAAALKVLEA
jgi:hypothetical protein